MCRWPELELEWFSSINRQFEPVWLALDDAHVRGVESTDPYDPGPVTDIAVVENQITRGGVIADVIDLGSSPARTPSIVKGRGSLAIFSTRLKSRNLKVRGAGAPGHGSGVIGELSGEGLIADSDLNVCHGGLLDGRGCQWCHGRCRRDRRCCSRRCRLTPGLRPG